MTVPLPGDLLIINSPPKDFTIFFVDACNCIFRCVSCAILTGQESLTTSALIDTPFQKRES